MFDKSKITNSITYCFIALMIALSIGGCSEGEISADSKEVETSNRDQIKTRSVYVSQAQIRELLPGKKMTSAYFTLTNNTAEPVTLSGAQSSAAKAIEMHTLQMKGEQMRMRPLETVQVEPGDSVSFISGGHHLMLFGVEPLKPSTTITLEFTNGLRLPVEFSKVKLMNGEEH